MTGPGVRFLNRIFVIFKFRNIISMPTLLKNRFVSYFMLKFAFINLLDISELLTNTTL